MPTTRQNSKQNNVGLPIVLLKRLPAKASPSLPKKLKPSSPEIPVQASKNRSGQGQTNTTKSKEKRQRMLSDEKDISEWMDCSSSKVEETSIEIARAACKESDDAYFFNDSSIIIPVVNECQPKNSTFQEAELECSLEHFFMPNISPIIRTPDKPSSPTEQQIPLRPKKVKRKSEAKKLRPKSDLQVSGNQTIPESPNIQDEYTHQTPHTKQIQQPNKQRRKLYRENQAHNSSNYDKKQGAWITKQKKPRKTEIHNSYHIFNHNQACCQKKLPRVLLTKVEGVPTHSKCSPNYEVHAATSFGSHRT